MAPPAPDRRPGLARRVPESGEAGVPVVRAVESHWHDYDSSEGLEFSVGREGSSSGTRSRGGDVRADGGRLASAR